MFLENVSEADRGDILEELGFLQLVSQGRLVIDEGSHEKLTVHPQLLLAVGDEGSPVSVESSNPLLTLLGLELLRGSKEEYIISAGRRGKW